MMSPVAPVAAVPQRINLSWVRDPSVNAFATRVADHRRLTGSGVSAVEAVSVM
jgi:hypothetical protein